MAGTDECEAEKSKREKTQRENEGRSLAGERNNSLY